MKVRTLQEYRMLSLMLKVKSTDKEVKLLKSRHKKEIVYHAKI